MKQLLYILLTISLAFVSLEAGNPKKAKKVKKKVDHTTIIDPNATTATIKMKKGKVEAIKFEVKLGTGYKWHLENLDAKLKEAAKPRFVEQKKQTEKIAGQPEAQIFYLKAVESGQADVVFEHKPGFGKNPETEKKVTVTFEIE